MILMVDNPHYKIKKEIEFKIQQIKQKNKLTEIIATMSPETVNTFMV